LKGKRSVAELTDFIAKSMPPGKVHVEAADAKKLGTFVYNSFYSPLAQERNRPARVSLLRLTVNQYRNSVMDLISIPHQPVPTENPGGLYGEYFKGRDQNSNNRAFKRIDPEVNFDFGNQAPGKEGFDAHFFSIAWQGDVLAPDTGEYEFLVRSDQSCLLYVNGWKKPLIDAQVRSSNSNDFKATIHLIGGRAYPIRLVFVKAGQGVDNTAKTKEKPPVKAFVQLLWTRPQHATEPIPSFCLFTQTDVPSFVPSTTFPPDDRSMGYERGSSVSREWDEATTNAALEVATYVTDNLADVTGAQENAKDRKDRLISWSKHFVERAFRRPLTPDLEQKYVSRSFDVAATLEGAIKRVVILALKSPRFLYREIPFGPRPDRYTLASELSFNLWDTLPDFELMRAAEAGELDQEDGLSRQIQRMANDPRAWAKLRGFLLHWLKVDEVPDIVKEPKHYPDFDVAVASDLRTSLELFLQQKAWKGNSNYRDLMLSPDQFINGRLAKIYGVNLPPNSPFQPVQMDPNERIGVITQPYLLTRFAYLDGSSPIHRGVLILRNLLGRMLNPPPAAFAPLAANLHPDMTTRQRVALQTSPEMCNACHGIINPLGFTLEKFDAIGRIRSTDNGKSIDCSGSYEPILGQAVEFRGAVDLAKYLANSDESHSAFVEKLFQHLTQQPVLAYGPNTLNRLKARFSENSYSIRSVMAEIAKVALNSESGNLRP